MEQIEKLLTEIQATEQIRHQRFESQMNLLEQIRTQLDEERSQVRDLLTLLKQAIAAADSQAGRVEEVTAALIKIQLAQQDK
jgi:hypothetical protein